MFLKQQQLILKNASCHRFPTVQCIPLQCLVCLFLLSKSRITLSCNKKAPKKAIKNEIKALLGNNSAFFQPLYIVKVVEALLHSLYRFFSVMKPPIYNSLRCFSSY